MKMSTALAMHE